MKAENTIRWFLERLSNVSAYMSGNQVVLTMSNGTVQLDSENYDNLNEFNTGTYTFTALYDGFYRAMVKLGVLVGAGSGVLLTQILTTGAATVGQSYLYAQAAVNNSVGLFVDVELDAGEILYVVLDNQTANNVTILSGAYQSYFAVERVPVIG